MWETIFFVNNIFLGIGLAMDAFSVSLANGLNEPKMRKSRMFGESAIFALFQAAMPMIGWICVKTIMEYFKVFELFIPWIALTLLCFIGGKMLYDGIKNNKDNDVVKKLGVGALIIQGVATSIDALSVGFTIAEYDFIHAIVAVLIIGLITWVICFGGIVIGKKFGTKISNKATIVGGIILIIIGIEIFLTGILG